MKYDSTELALILETIRGESTALKQKKVTLGFDAFIDHLVKIIRHKDDLASPTFFASSLEFGEYIIAKGAKNFSVEVEEIASKIGGNMPITASALAKYVNSVNCVGPLGHPVIDSTFQELSKQCKLYSFGNPGVSQLLEFKTGKIMLAHSGQLQSITWEMLRDAIGIETLKQLFSNTDLAVLLNWGELDYSTPVWKGLLDEVLSPPATAKRSLGFFDLSDCSNRTHAQVNEALELIRTFGRHWQVTLSLNLNESAIVYEVLTGQAVSNQDSHSIAHTIFKMLDIETVLIHHSKYAIAVSKAGMEKRESFFLAHPLISTGAGDNFNAGYCIGRLLKFGNGPSLTLGNAVASLYMQAGISPALQDIEIFLSQQL